MAASEGPTFIPGLVQRMRSGSWIRQAAAVSSLLQLASTDRDNRREIVAAGAVPALVGCLQSSSEAVYVPAAQALTQLARGISAAEAQPAIQPLLACLGSEDEGLHSAATRALCAMALASWRTCEAIAAAAVEQLESEGCSEEGQVAALGALRQLAAAGLSNREILSGQLLADSTGVLKPLVRCMHEDRPAAVQAEAVAALAAIAEHNYGCIFQIQHTDAIQWLVRLHLRPGTSPPLQRSAEAALHQLAQSGCGKAVDALKAVNYQRQLQDSDHESVKLVGRWLKAALALGRITASFDAAMEAAAQRLEQALDELGTPAGRARAARVAGSAAAASASRTASSAGTAGTAGSAEASTAAPPTPHGRPEPPSLAAAAAAQRHLPGKQPASARAAPEEPPPPPQQQPQPRRSGHRRRRQQQVRQQAPSMTAEEMAAAEAAAQAAAAELLAEDEEEAQRQAAAKAAAKAAKRQRQREQQREAMAALDEEQGRGSGGEGDAETAGASVEEPAASAPRAAAEEAAAAEDAYAAGEDGQLQESSQEQEEQQQQPEQHPEQQPAAGSQERSSAAAGASLTQMAATAAEVPAPHTPEAVPLMPGSSSQSSATGGGNGGGSSSGRRQRGRRRGRHSAAGSEMAADGASAVAMAGAPGEAGCTGTTHTAGTAGSAAAPAQQPSPDATAELELLLEQLGVGSSSSAPTADPISPPGRAANEPAAAAAVVPAPGAHSAMVAMGSASAAAAAVAAGAAPAGPSGPAAGPLPPLGLDPDLAEELLCCITQEPMDDPVVAADSFTYERSAIEGEAGRDTHQCGVAPATVLLLLLLLLLQDLQLR